MKRSPLKRTKFLKRNPERGIKQRSKKQNTLYAKPGGRREFVASLLADHPKCEALVEDVCTLRSVDVHELLARSQGGSILDRENCIAVCRMCHSWIGENPKKATERGLRRSLYKKYKN